MGKKEHKIRQDLIQGLLLINGNIVKESFKVAKQAFDKPLDSWTDQDEASVLAFMSLKKTIKTLDSVYRNILEAYDE